MAKQKMKVSKTLKERFKVTKGGKLVHSRGGLKHRRSKERTSLKLRGGKPKTLKGPEAKKVRKILGISVKRRGK